MWTGENKTRLIAASPAKFIFFVAALLLVSSAYRRPLQARQQAGSMMEAVPNGWYVYKGSLDTSTSACFNWSHDNWRVSLEGSDVKIARVVQGDEEQTALPPRLKIEPEMVGRRSVMKFPDSWLLGFAGGEMGGGLWLSNADGSVTKRISATDVQGMVPVGDGVLVLLGLRHVTLDYGDALILSQPHGMSVGLEHSIHLDGAPSAGAKDSDGSVIVLTTNGLSRINEAGELHRLVGLPDFMDVLYPKSMVKAGDGSLYIGMRMVVLRLLPPNYKPEWLLPNECRHFSLRKYDCVCKP